MADSRLRKRISDAYGDEGEPRPRKAFRLVDGEDAPRAAGQPSFEESCTERDLGDLRAAMSTAPCAAYAIQSVTPVGEGETVAVVLVCPQPDGGKPKRIKLRLLTEQYAELEVKVGEITEDRADGLMEAGRLCAAILRGMALLQYGDQSARRLAYKLTAKGVDRETAATAASYLVAKGYIQEDSTALLRAWQGVRKGWGVLRIREDLLAHGFSSEAVEGAVEGLAEVDFAENCAGMIRKKYGGVPADKPTRQKLTAALMRLGYEFEEIREAMRRVLRDK